MVFEENSLRIKLFTFNPFLENTYIVWDTTSRDGVVFDPGMSTPEEESDFSGYLESKKINLRACINTHCHLDHIWGNGFVKKTYNVPFIIPELELPLFNAYKTQGSSFGVEIPEQPKVDMYINTEEKLRFGEITLQPLFTPGHSPGEFSFYIENSKYMIVGDVIFQEGIGRTDLWGGNLQILINSINNKIFSYPDSTILLPGHGEDTTISHERALNPYL